jgi:RimJ/RimL family protein N-acetyltransferase
MDQKQIIFEGEIVKGKHFIIRYPQEGDAQVMCDYINALSEERAFVRFQGEKMAVEEEREFLDKELKAIKELKAVMLFVIVENRIVGIAALDMKDKTESHQGVLGISIVKEYRGEGLGKRLMAKILEEGKRCIPQLRIIVLGLFENNHRARQMYEEFGFVEFGRLPKGILYRGDYVDEILMYK